MTSENIPNRSIRDMIRQLSGSNVTAANMYTPTIPFKVNYCGIKDDLADYLYNEPQIVNSVLVTFNREESKTATVRKKIPEIELREDNALGFYRKKGIKYKKIKDFDKELKEMAKRRARQELAIYLYVENDNIPVDHPQPPDNSTPAEADGNEDEDLSATENQSNGDDQIQNQPVYENGWDNLNQSRDINNHSSPSRSPARSNYSVFDHFRPASDELELPDPADCFSWKKITDIPVGQELSLQDVAEADLPSISKFVQEVKMKTKIFEEMDVNTALPSEMSSNCSLSELLEKGKLLSQEFADFKSDRKLSSSLLTFLCLIAASDAVEETHVVTPDEVKNIQNNVAPIKPAQNVKNILILNTDDLPLIALVKMDNWEYYLNSIITINNSKHYVSKLLIRDICNKLNIDVNYSETVCENLLEFSSEAGEKLPYLSLFFSARNMLGLNPPSSLNELERLIEMAHIRIKELKQTSEVDSEIDWFSNYENSRKRNREED